MVKFYRLGTSDGQGPLPRAWVEKRGYWESRDEVRWLDHSIEIAPGVHVALLATGNAILPSGKIHMTGATIAVWTDND